MADFKVEIEFDGDNAKVVAYDLITMEKVTYTNDEINDVPPLKAMILLSKMFKSALTLSGTI